MCGKVEEGQKGLAGRRRTEGPGEEGWAEAREVLKSSGSATGLSAMMSRAAVQCGPEREGGGRGLRRAP